MSEPQAAEAKPSFWRTLREGWGPYKRLFAYVKPYKFRFGLGLACGLGFGLINGCLPLVLAQVMGAVFHGGGPTSARAFATNPELMNAGPKINDIILTCLWIPAVMAARSLCAYGNSFYMNWVSNRVVTDIRDALFSKMVGHSMDFFNRMRSGFLMSRITNDTRGMQMGVSTVSSDLFKQPVAILAGVAVLLYMDWKFTLVTLVLFPACLFPIIFYGKKARKAVQFEQEDMGQMVVTMQETFAGIRIIKSFTREKHQEDQFRHSNKLQFQNMMRMIMSMEAVGPLVELIAAAGVGLALVYIYAANLSAARFIALNAGIILLYEPIKVLSRMHVVMQRSIQATVEVFAILDSDPSVKDAPDAVVLPRSRGLIEFDDATFRYAGGVTNAVSNLTLRIEPGKSYALVGASGAGK
ncbi:MAG: ABC transporter ATP-binding protein, partial [Verrucomicrobiaceae bacterium]|nr:ABC transporter ATP-binding protein [Verrucomicrobiaceae bacterium]